MPRLSRRDRNGQTTTELALVLPLFILLLVGIFDVGRAVFAYNAVANAAREGTRLAIVDQSVGGVQAIAAQRSIQLGIDPNSVVVGFENLNGSQTAPCNAHPVEIGCMVEVTVTYQYVAATPVISAFIGPISISATSRQAVERSSP